jgi:hypothetical protein
MNGYPSGNIAILKRGDKISTGLALVISKVLLFEITLPRYILNLFLEAHHQVKCLLAGSKLKTKIDGDRNSTLKNILA